jgi:hypothetical protein
VFDVGRASLGHRGNEVEHGPIRDELELHVTILTGDAMIGNGGVVTG